MSENPPAERTRVALQQRRAVAFSVLNLLYCTWSLFEPRIPGWKMFASFAPQDASLRDRDGREVSLRDYVPRGAPLGEAQVIPQIARFVCLRNPERAPFYLSYPSQGLSLEFHTPGCRADAVP